MNDNDISYDIDNYDELDISLEITSTHYEYLEEMIRYEQELTVLKAKQNLDDIQTEDFKETIGKIGEGIKKAISAALEFMRKALKHVIAAIMFPIKAIQHFIQNKSFKGFLNDYKKWFNGKTKVNVLLKSDKIWWNKEKLKEDDESLKKVMDSVEEDLERVKTIIMSRTFDPSGKLTKSAKYEWKLWEKSERDKGPQGYITKSQADKLETTVNDEDVRNLVEAVRYSMNMEKNYKITANKLKEIEVSINNLYRRLSGQEYDKLQEVLKNNEEAKKTLMTVVRSLQSRVGWMGQYSLGFSRLRVRMMIDCSGVYKALVKSDPELEAQYNKEMDERSKESEAEDARLREKYGD
jgi:hypothetical protein